MTPEDLPVGLIEKIEPEPMSGCWLWAGSCTRDDYGRVWHEGRACRAHRVVYELLVGPIAPGLQLDHLCRVRNCVNPVHLRQVMSRENLLAPGSVSLAKLHSERTVCKGGHSYDRFWRGARKCSKCSNAYKRRWRAMNRGHVAAYKRRWRKADSQRSETP